MSHKEVAELFLAAFPDPDQGSDVSPMLVPSIPSLEFALSTSIAMSTSPGNARLGGLAGYKLGWKNKFTTQNHPALFGPIFNNYVYQHTESPRISVSANTLWCAEAEYGFTFGAALLARSTPYTEAEVYAAVGGINLCIELCGSRQTTSVDPLVYVADALCGACVVVGPAIEKAQDPSSLATVPVELLVDDVRISTGSGLENPFDSPLASLTFLVNSLCLNHAANIPAGTLVITGHCSQAGFKSSNLSPIAAPPHVAADIVDENMPFCHIKATGSRVTARFGATGWSLGEVEAVLTNDRVEPNVASKL